MGRPGLLSSVAWIVLLAAGTAQSAFAQTPDLVKVPTDTPEDAPVPAAPEGSGFTFGATAAAGEMFSDNIYVTKNYPVGDTISTLALGGTAGWKGSTDQFSIAAGTNLGRYAQHATENYDDYYLNGTGRVQVDSATTLFGGAREDWTHESRESPDALNGITPTQYRSGDFYAGLLRSFTDFVLRVGAAIDTYAFDDVQSSQGLIDSHDRNRAQYEAGARIAYRWTDTLQPFVQAYYDTRRYDQSPDDFGYRRNSSGYRAAAGIAGNFSTMQGEIYAGVLSQDFSDTRFSDATKLDFGARFRWRPVAGTQISAFLDRSLEETALAGSSGYLRTALGGAVESEIRPDLYLSGHLNYAQNDYQDVGRTDRVNDIGMGTRYFLSPNFYLSIDDSFLHRTSNIADADFYENRVWLRVGAQLSPAYRSDPESFPPVSDQSAPAGFYVAALAGNGTLGAAQDGPRGSGGTRNADFGGNGWQGGAAAGYGIVLGHAYLGAEVDASSDSQSWLHNGTGGTRIFGVRALNDVGLSARLGYARDDGTLFYGLFGIAGAKFATSYVQKNNSVRQDNFERGLRVGAGIEVPLDGNVSGRMEYVRTSYADYQVVAGQAADDFTGNSDLLRFGLVFHPNGAAPAAGDAPPLDPGGFYAGLQGGFGSLISQNAGPRNPPQTIDVQRAGSGARAGIFTGYGYVIGRFYLGGEIQADSGNEDWNIKRDPTGRVYSVTSTASFGLSLLGGYLFQRDMIYMRLGLAESEFADRYHDETGQYYVTPSYLKPGLRLGGGMETPLNDGILLRLDYTWTRYSRYQVDYVTGIDSFRNSENQLRVGLVFPF